MQDCIESPAFCIVGQEQDKQIRKYGKKGKNGCLKRQKKPKIYNNKRY